MKKWTQTRDSWMKCMKKQKDEKKSGSAAKPSRYYLYHDQTCFLKKITNLTTTQESTDDNTIDENRGGRQNDEDEQNIKVYKSPINQPGAFLTQRKRKSEMTNELDTKMLKFIDNQIHSTRNEENHHLSFFKGLLPSMSSLNEDQTLEFQAGVISLLQKISKNTLQYAYHTTQIRHHGIQNQYLTPTSMQHNFGWPNSGYYPQPPVQPQQSFNNRIVAQPKSSPVFESATSPAVSETTSQNSEEFIFSDLI